MRLWLAALLGCQIEANINKGAGFNIIQGSAGKVLITRYQNYGNKMRRSGYCDGRDCEGCTAAHISSQTEGWSYSSVGSDNHEKCTLVADFSVPLGQPGNAIFPSGTCGEIKPAAYTVTEVELRFGDNDNYCYGYKTESFPKPSGPYRWSDWLGGGTKMAWESFVNDAGNNGSHVSGAYGITAEVHDIDTNSPQVTVPSIWRVMAGCASQTLDLSPIDLDGDRVECHWANLMEGMGASRGEPEKHLYDSISLDPITCILTYDGTMDASTHGKKPVAVQVKDYDANGVMRSSMPVQFMVDVSTSEKTCDEKPSLVGATPAAREVLDARNGITITVAAQATYGATITDFRHQSPLGMTCTGISMVNIEATISCSWTPTAAQKGQVFNFCFMAEDSDMISSERRCVSLDAGSSDVDECTAGTDNCPAGTICKNTIGSFLCDRKFNLLTNINNKNYYEHTPVITPSYASAPKLSDSDLCCGFTNLWLRSVGFSILRFVFV